MYTFPSADDGKQSLGQLRARVEIRKEIAKQDLKFGNEMAYMSNMKEIARLERLIHDRERSL
ncbi:hypothetical protein EBT25_14250 [bacterium]|jgi:hypothetical protein|nr:hypothetical protein [bacterium]